MSPKIMIILSSVRPGRMADRLAIAMKKIIEDEGLEPMILDPQDLPLEIVKIPLHFHKDPEKEAPKWLLEANERIKEAAGYIVISAEYNCTVPPALSNMLDHFPLSSFVHKPAGIVTYSVGPHGGVRGQVALRPFLSEMGLVTIPCKNVAVHDVHQTVDKDGKVNCDFTSSQLVKLLKDVEWYANALQGHKDKIPPPPMKVHTLRDIGIE